MVKEIHARDAVDAEFDNVHEIGCVKTGNTLRCDLETGRGKMTRIIKLDMVTADSPPSSSMRGLVMGDATFFNYSKRSPGRCQVVVSGAVRPGTMSGKMFFLGCEKRKKRRR